MLGKLIANVAPCPATERVICALSGVQLRGRPTSASAWWACVACEGPPQSRMGLRCRTREPDGSSGTLGRAPCPVASRVPA